MPGGSLADEKSGFSPWRNKRVTAALRRGMRRQGLKPAFREHAFTARLKLGPEYKSL